MSKPLSSLDEINRVVTRYCYAMLKSVDSQRWQDPSQIIYASASDASEAFKEYLRRAAKRTEGATTNIKLPIAVVVRAPEIEIYKQWSDAYDVASVLPSEEEISIGCAEVNGSIVRPFKSEYMLVVFDNTLREIEMYIDHAAVLQIMRHQQVDFDSEVLGFKSRVSINFRDPLITQTPTYDDRVAGTGQIYGMQIPISLDGILGVPRKSAVILTTVLETYTQIPTDIPFTEDEEDEMNASLDSVDTTTAYTSPGEDIS